MSTTRTNIRSITGGFFCPGNMRVTNGTAVQHLPGGGWAIGNITTYPDGSVSITGDSETEQVVVGDGRVVTTMGACVYGNRNTVSGMNVRVYGNHNVVSGMNAEVWGDDCTVSGMNATCHGLRCHVTGMGGRYHNHTVDLSEFPPPAGRKEEPEKKESTKKKEPKKRKTCTRTPACTIAAEDAPAAKQAAVDKDDIVQLTPMESDTVVTDRELSCGVLREQAPANYRRVWPSLPMFCLCKENHRRCGGYSLVPAMPLPGEAQDDQGFPLRSPAPLSTPSCAGSLATDHFPWDGREKERKRENERNARRRRNAQP
jgi:hypothetical protein